MLRSLFSRKPKPRLRRWVNRPADLPWTDHPDALEQLAERERRGSIDTATAPLVRKWINDGYCVLENVAPAELTEAINAEMDGYWQTDVVEPRLTFNDVYMKEGENPVHVVKHEEIVALSPEERLAVRARGKWRTHGFHMISPNAEKLFRSGEIRRVVSLLLGVDTAPLYSINFTWGSRHGIHQDLMVFHVHPMNFLIGAWIALEDIGPDCGPVIYYPGSHKEPVYREYDNYPQTNLRTSDDALRKRYEAHLAEIATKYERRQFLAKRGDCLLWHAMLLHGGDDIRDTSLTRRSFVIHYVPEKMNKAEEVVGPFMW